MKNVTIKPISQGQINFYNTQKKALIGRISMGFIYGEWWVEPNSDLSAQLIKGKKNAVNYLLKGNRNGILDWDRNIQDLFLRRGI